MRLTTTKSGIRVVVNFFIACLSLIFLSAHASAQDPLARNLAMFPNAIVPPPIPVTGADGKLFIPGWIKTGRDDAFFQPEGGADAGFLQIIRQNDGYNIDSFFDLLISEAGLDSVSRPDGQEAEAFKATFGPMVAAVFGKAREERQEVRFFADLYGPDEENNVIGTIIYASPEVFDSWDGVLLPLVRNGYVENPDMFDNRAVMRAGSDAEKTGFYVGMVNTKIISEMGALSTLSAGAAQAARNASTIAGCAGASNCSISYDGSGNAVADFDTE